MSELAERLERLEATGGFEKPRLVFVRRLLAAAEADDRVRSRLERRARETLDACERSLDAARARSAAAVATFRGRPEERELHAAHDAGDFVRVLRTARRRKRGLAAEGPRLQLVARLRRAGHRGATPDEALALAERRYRVRAGERIASEVLAGARARLPEQVGPYHGPSVAARSLEDLGERWRPLLRAWLGRLDALDASLPPPAPPAPKRRRR